MPTNQCIQNYFSSLNPVAEKIAFDINEVKSAYDHVWLTLSSTEQDNILNDTIIKPEITINYYKNGVNGTKNTSLTKNDNDENVTKLQKYNPTYTYDKQNLQTFNHQHVGLKVLHDENIGDYRDEHSFPFSYRTKSQINLAVIAKNIQSPVKDSDLCKPSPQVAAMKSLQPAPRKPPKAEQPSKIIPIQIEPRHINRNKYNESTYIVDDEKLNLLPSFGSKNTLLSISTDSTDFDNDTKEQNAENCKLLPEEVEIPKGFDFLSNW